MRLTGLQAKMTASYVLVTAAAVVLVEAVVIGLVLPNVVSRLDLRARVQATAATQAIVASKAWTSDGAPPGNNEFPFYASAQAPVPGVAAADSSGGLQLGRDLGRYRSSDAPLVLSLLVSRDGTVLASSFPGQYPVGSRPTLPYDPATQLKDGGDGTVDGGSVTWATAPVVLGGFSSQHKSPARAGPSASPKSAGPSPIAVPAPSAAARAVATVYVQAPAGAKVTGTTKDLGPSLRTALLVLALLLPVGAVFGYLTTRRLVHRVRRLQESAALVADGDLGQRVDVSGRDELGRLEAGFNVMAGQLETSLDAERRLSEGAARSAERARIARELHDSVSQDLFSVRLLASGLARALPAESELRSEVDALERTSRSAMREMQALLLELRPVALEEGGLSAALEEMCRTYRARLGLHVSAEVAALDVTPNVEHAVLRVAQEALANAVKHADADSISLVVQQADGHVSVRVHDDGQGFAADEAKAKGGLGLRLMRDRVAELGGTLEVESTAGAGTTVSVRLPVGTGP